MPAYVIAEVEVSDAETYRIYQAPTKASVLRHGGRFMVRGGTTEALEGEPPKRIVVLEFPDLAAARRWYDSPDYGEARELRWRSATTRLFIVEGSPPD
jgi:uncharacterized protein (DUF1330 family)